MDLFKAFTEDENNGFQSKNNDNQNMNNHEQNNKKEDTSNIWVIKKNRTEEQNELISKMNKIQNMHSDTNDSKDNTFVPIHLRKHKPISRLNNCNNINQSQLQSQSQFLNFYENSDDNNNFQSNNFQSNNFQSNNFQSNNFQSNNFQSNNNLQKSFNMYSSNKKQMTPREQRLEKYKQMELRKNNNFIDINSKT